MMGVASLRHLLVGHNQLIKLPEIIENCAIEVINLESNQIEKLPKELLKSAHRYAFKFSRLLHLVYAT